MKLATIALRNPLNHYTPVRFQKRYTQITTPYVIVVKNVRINVPWIYKMIKNKTIAWTTLLVLALTSVASATYPDGTLILSSKKGLVGRVAKRMTGGDQYTHIAIVFGGYAYESDWPRYKRSCACGYGKARTTNDYYVPAHPYSAAQVQAMKAYALSQMGRPYSLQGYKRGRYNPRSTWCSPFVGETLRRGNWPLSFNDMREPQNLIGRVGSNYVFVRRVCK